MFILQEAVLRQRVRLDAFNQIERGIIIYILQMANKIGVENSQKQQN